MTKYRVTLTKVVRVNGKRRESGDVVEVDKRTLAELTYHNAFDNVVELQADDEQISPKQTDDKQVDGEGDKTPAATLLETLPEYKNIKGDDIKDQLTLRSIPFDTNDKSELYELLKTAMENETEVGE